MRQPLTREMIQARRKREMKAVRNEAEVREVKEEVSVVEEGGDAGGEARQTD